MQGWHYGKGLIYYRPIFRLTKLVFLKFSFLCSHSFVIDIVGKICQDTVKINPGWSFFYDSHKHPVWLRMDITRGNLGLIASEQNHTSPPPFSCKGIVKDSYLSPVKGVQRRSNNRPSCSCLFLIPTVGIYNSLTSPFLREETWIHLYPLFNSIQFNLLRWRRRLS